MEGTKPAKEKTIGFFDMDRIPVTLTYMFTDPPTEITFYCKMALAADDLDARQKFYAQTDDQQKAGEHAYYVDLLARITAAPPEGLPGFDDFMPGSDAAERVANFFSIGAQSPMKRKVVADVVEHYTRITQPIEFFR
jgi:hypothetical protein